MENQNQAPAMNPSQKVARSSWMLFILAIILTVLSRQIPRAVVPCEIAVFVVLVAGVVCAVVGLSGIRRHGTQRVLWPSLVGVVLNGLVLFIFATNFAAARAAAKSQPQRVAQTPAHIGTWDAKTPRGDTMSYTFAPGHFSLTLADGRQLSGTYSIEYDRNPIWMTIQTQDGSGGRQTMPFIVEFLNQNKMRMLGPARGTNARPTEFGDRADILIFDRRL
jgi:uncharacterized protein (TIGR03067 family)